MPILSPVLILLLFLRPAAFFLPSFLELVAIEHLHVLPGLQELLHLSLRLPVLRIQLLLFGDQVRIIPSQFLQRPVRLLMRHSPHMSMHTTSRSRTSSRRLSACTLLRGLIANTQKRAPTNLSLSGYLVSALICLYRYLVDSVTGCRLKHGPLQGSRQIVSARFPASDGVSVA